jgi:hypothetical protein
VEKLEKKKTEPIFPLYLIENLDSNPIGEELKNQNDVMSSAQVFRW